jgi:hypothetical protein
MRCNLWKYGKLAWLPTRKALVDNQNREFTTLPQVLLLLLRKPDFYIREIYFENVCIYYCDFYILLSYDKNT